MVPAILTGKIIFGYFVFSLYLFRKWRISGSFFRIKHVEEPTFTGVMFLSLASLIATAAKRGTCIVIAGHEEHFTLQWCYGFQVFMKGSVGPTLPFRCESPPV